MTRKVLTAAFLVLSACGSSEVNQTDENPKKSEAMQNAAIQIEKPDPEIKREEKVPDSQYSALNEAIKQQNDEAIQKSTAEILTQNSKDLKALNALAMVYYKKGRYEASAYLLNKALVAHPDSSEAYSNMGLVLLEKNETREAIKSFRKAIEINPLNSTAGANLGAIYVREKDYNKAILSLEIAVKNGIRDFKTMNNYAVALTGTGKTKEASEIYERLMRDNPSQKEVMLNYSILLIEELHKYKEGLDLLNRLKFVGSAPESRQVIKELEIKAKAGLQ